MAEQNTGKITQVIGAVLDIRFDQGVLPEINDAVEIRRKDGSKLVAETRNMAKRELAKLQRQHSISVTILSDVSQWVQQTDL